MEPPVDGLSTANVLLITFLLLWLLLAFVGVDNNNPTQDDEDATGCC